jgi:myosin heavy subunit
MNPPKFDRCDDLADLSYLNESSIFANLRDRFHSNMIYVSSYREEGNNVDL